MSAFVTLDYCVKNSLVDMYRTSDSHEYQRHLQWAIRSLRDINFSVFPQHKTVRLKVGNAGVADLPLDFVDWAVIGQKNGSGLIPFALNEHMVLDWTTDDCGNREKAVKCGVNWDTIVNSNGYGVFANSWVNGEFVGGWYGEGGGKAPAEFMIDHDRNQVMFSSNVSSEHTIIMEYISTGYTPGAKTKIPVMASEAVISGIHYYRLLHKPSAAAGEKRDAERIYIINKKKTAAMRWRYTLADLVRAVRTHQRQAPTI